MSASAFLHLATVKSGTLDADGCIDVDIDRLGRYRAAVAAMLAGNQRGVVFLPDDGDQVLVAAVAGANVQWVVVGSLWSRDDTPPEKNDDDKNSTKLIRTRAGNEIRFSDADGQESIAISSSNGEVSVHAKRVVIQATDSSTDRITLEGDVTIVGQLFVTDSVGASGVTIVGGAGSNKISGS